MDTIKYTYQNTSWGQDIKRVYEFDLVNNIMKGFEKGEGQFTKPLNDKEVEDIKKFFSRFLSDIQQEKKSFGFDAPIATLEVDGKAVKQGIANMEDPYYRELENFIEPFLKEEFI